MRSINQAFIDALKTGCLSFFLQQVINNKDELCLEIRDCYINIYYKGGNLLKIRQHKNQKSYSCYFDTKYCNNDENYGNREKLESIKPTAINDFINAFPIMMKEMDAWFGKHPKEERTFQHKLLVNNKNIIDIEYATPEATLTDKKKKMRLDMLVVEGDRLIIVENKFGTGAIGGKAGIKKHYKDICALIDTPAAFDELIESVKNIANAKYELGLLPQPVTNIDKAKTEILFLMVEFNHRSKALKSALESIDFVYPYKVLFMNENEFKLDLTKAK